MKNIGDMIDRIKIERKEDPSKQPPFLRLCPSLLRHGIIACVLILATAFSMNAFQINQAVFTVLTLEKNAEIARLNAVATENNTTPKDYIKWMEFNVPLNVLQQALTYDVQSYNQEVPLDWIQLLSYGAAKNWGKFKPDAKCKAIDELVEKLKKGETIAELTKDLKLYPFYLETYSAVLGGFVGEYEAREADPNNPGQTITVRKYGLKAFSPVARGFGYSHYDDFGVSRTYGYKRKHQGNDLMGAIGSPIIAVEDGYVEAMGWNQFGGWRVGIRSNDKKRYYYYAHLKKDHPFVANLKEGMQVKAGDVIGYLGRTGYSANENADNIKQPHLHFGMQIIFDETQKDGNNQIWIDVYHIVQLLAKNRMPVQRDTKTNEYVPSIIIDTYPMD